MTFGILMQLGFSNKQIFYYTKKEVLVLLAVWFKKKKNPSEVEILQLDFQLLM